MRYAWLFVLAACGGGPQKFDPNNCPALGPAPGPLCSDAYPRCGDGVYQNCWDVSFGVDGPCSFYAQHVEQCDGSDVPSCASFGLGPGTVSCGADCMADTRACGACGDDPRVTECANAPVNIYSITGRHVLVSSDPAAIGGPYLALASAQGQFAGFSVLRHGSTGFADVGGFTLPVLAIAAAPDGWFLAYVHIGELRVVRSDLLVTTTTETTIATPSSLGGVSIAYGPGGHALVAWVEYVNDASNVAHPQTQFAILDASGAVIVAPAILFPSTDDSAGTSATTDGTSFFVAASGRLARITSAGSVAAIVTGFPTIADPRSTVAPVAYWGTSMGWFAAQTASGQPWAAQPFDATGAASGSAVATPAVASAPITVGDDLVLAAAGTQTGLTVELSIMRVTASGTPTSNVPVGSTAVATGFPEDTGVGAFNGSIAVFFHGAAGAVLALVAP